jgi:single-strand DNA-binding protein
MINKVILMGRLGKDPVVRRLENGRVVANVTLATNDYYTKDGQRLESTEWHNLEMWDRQAETAEKYLKKGSLLYLEGKIRTDRYTDADGQERQARKIRVSTFQMMGSMLTSRSEEGGNREQGNEGHSSETFHQEGPNSLDGGSDVQDEELPF